jgi:hypothetical protein
MLNGKPIFAVDIVFATCHLFMNEKGDCHFL